MSKNKQRVQILFCSCLWSCWILWVSFPCLPMWCAVTKEPSTQCVFIINHAWLMRLSCAFLQSSIHCSLFFEYLCMAPGNISSAPPPFPRVCVCLTVPCERSFTSYTDSLTCVCWVIRESWKKAMLLRKIGLLVPWKDEEAKYETNYKNETACLLTDTVCKTQDNPLQKNVQHKKK